MKKLHITSVKVLPYHSLDRSKYAALRMPDTLPAVEPPSKSDLQKAEDILNQSLV